MNLHRCDCSGTSLLSACVAQQHCALGQCILPGFVSHVRWCGGTADLYEQQIFIGVTAV